MYVIYMYMYIIIRPFQLESLFAACLHVHVHVYIGDSLHAFINTLYTSIIITIYVSIDKG